LQESSPAWLESLDQRLRDVWMPGDWFQLTSQVAGHYAAKAATIEGYRPARAIEIGTRCGYSLAAFSVASSRTRWLCN